MAGEVVVGDPVFVTYKDGEAIRRARGKFQGEDQESITISLDNYVIRIFKSAIFKIEKPKNNRRDFEY